MSETTMFQTSPGFCDDCGSILPLLRARGGVQCFACKKEFPVEALQHVKMQYTIHFNSVAARAESLGNAVKSKESKVEDDGPVIDRKCPKCNNDKMSYATLQLRSADEGQTVFFTCTKCKHKETENS